MTNNDNLKCTLLILMHSYSSSFYVKNPMVNMVSFENLLDAGLLGIGDEDLSEVVAAG